VWKLETTSEQKSRKGGRGKRSQVSRKKKTASRNGASSRARKATGFTMICNTFYEQPGGAAFRVQTQRNDKNQEIPVTQFDQQTCVPALRYHPTASDGTGVCA
jgi:hypothetical protein